jgi:thioredoxin-dependent peroxiredoxin
MRTFLGLVTMLGTLAMFTTLRAEPLAVGAHAPAVTATTDTGATLDFANVYKKGYTLVYFFPKAFTSGCTAEGCSLRDGFQSLSDKGVTVIGVSADDVARQHAFKEKYHFPFTLIADPGHKVMDAFGVPLMTIPAFGTIAHRQSFLINKDGVVVWRELKASTAEQASDVLKALKDLGAS